MSDNNNLPNASSAIMIDEKDGSFQYINFPDFQQHDNTKHDNTK